MSLTQLADEDLMQLMRRGEAAAFEAVYERHATAADRAHRGGGAPP
jgi:RNA polymerase sigma-70 factor (ECF subfamily)